MNPPEVRAPVIHAEEFTVPDSAIDGNGHVNNVAFVQWMQDVATRHFALAGCVEVMRAAGGTWVARSHHIEYLRPAFAGERLRVLTWVADFSRVRSLRRYRFLNVTDGKLLVRGETNWVFINASTGRPASVPEEIRGAFTLVTADREPEMLGQSSSGALPICPSPV
jgi:acyl-CoA thioester hydrolase